MDDIKITSDLEFDFFDLMKDVDAIIENLNAGEELKIVRYAA